MLPAKIAADFGGAHLKAGATIEPVRLGQLARGAGLRRASEGLPVPATNHSSGIDRTLFRAGASSGSSGLEGEALARWSYLLSIHR